MRNFLLAAAAATFALTAPPALAQSRIGPAEAPAPTPTSAAEYVRQAALSDRYEVESSRLALGRAQSEDLKRFAQHMIDEHTATSAALMAALPRAGVAPPDVSAPDRVRQGLLDALQQAQNGGEFDRRYRAQQVQAHREALALHQNYAANGDNAVLRGVAAQTAPRVAHHLEMLNRIR